MSVNQTFPRLWSGTQLVAMARRIGLDPPRYQLLSKVSEALVQALWKQHPDLTARQVVARLGADNPLGEWRAHKLLKACRLAAANRSRVHKKVGWYLDQRTTERIRISSAIKKHPDFTARQTIEYLGAGPLLKLRWVQRIMRQYWRAYS